MDTTKIQRAAVHGSASNTLDSLTSKNANDEALIGFGENMSLTYFSTGKKNLDLFFDSVPGMSKEQLEIMLTEAWREDATVALRIIFQLGDPRDGKSDLQNFYRAMLWLYRHHYDTFMLNVPHISTFTFYGALLDLLQFVCHPELLEAKIEAKGQHKLRKSYIRTREATRARRKQRQITREKLVQEFLAEQPSARQLTMRVEVKPIPGKPYLPQWKWADETCKDLFVKFVEDKNQIERQMAKDERKKKCCALNEIAHRMLDEDKRYRLFFDMVADIFARDIRIELASAKAGKSIPGLVGKWAPSLNGQHDRRTSVVDGIVERLFPSDHYKLEEGTYEQYLSFMRDKYRRTLSMLRGAAEVPEHFIGGQQWHLVNYSRMPSRCRLVHGHIFAKHDRQRYEEYLELAKAGKVKGPAAGAVLPHQLVRKAVMAEHSQIDDAKLVISETSLQWLRLVSDINSRGSLPSALSVCDVSGSMHGTPMEVAVALSLLLSDIADSPWKHRICTFSASPKFVTVPEATSSNLGQRAEMVTDMDWGMNTDLGKVFSEILSMASFYSVPQKDMPHYLFIFSDMEFDQSTKGCWQTDLDDIRRKYKGAGYEVPQIVFWNLRPSISHPATSEDPGVALLSGFSAGMLKAFLEFRLDRMTPIAQMLASLERYACLKVAGGDIA